MAPKRVLVMLCAVMAVLFLCAGMCAAQEAETGGSGADQLMDLLDQIRQRVGTKTPTLTPTGVVIVLPSDTPTATLTDIPTATPTDVPTATPTDIPTATATDIPTATATDIPTATPTDIPTATPTDIPTATATMVPTLTPTPEPTARIVRVYEHKVLTVGSMPDTYFLVPTEQNGEHQYTYEECQKYCSELCLYNGGIKCYQKCFRDHCHLEPPEPKG